MARLSSSNLSKSILSLIFIVFSFSSTALMAQDQPSALGTCTGVIADETYNIIVDSLLTGVTYNIIVNDSLYESNHAGPATYTTSAPIDFVDGLASSIVRVVNNTTGDTTDINVHEVLCVDVDGDGDLDFNEAACDYTKEMPDIGTIIATAAPYNGTNIYMYLLADTSGLLVDTIPSFDGRFTDLENGMYEVYAYTFLDTMEANLFMDNLSLGDDLDGSTGGSDPLCYSHCGIAPFTVDCECLVSIDADPSDMTVCEGEDATTSVSASINAPVPNGATLEYFWEVDSGSGFTGAGDTDSILNLSSVAFTDSGNVYRVIVTMDVAGTKVCRDTSATAILNVEDRPEMLASLDAMVCSDEVSGIVLATDPSMADADDYNIVEIDSNGLVSSAGNPSASLGVTTNVNIISGHAWTNTSAADVIVTYSVSPSTGMCAGDTIDIELTVKPEPLFTGDLDAMVCGSDSIDVVLPATADGGLTIDSFYITAVVPPAFTGTASTGGTTSTTYIEDDSYSNLTGEQDTVVYTVTPFAGTCPGESFDIEVIIKPEPMFADDIRITVCSGDAIGEVLAFVDDNGATIASYDISAVKGSVSIGGTPSTGNSISNPNFIAGDIFTNTTSETDSVTYTLTPTSTGGCVGESYDIVIVINKEPVGSDPAEVVCSDEAVSITLQDLVTNATSGTTFIRWALPNANISAGIPTDTVAATLISGTFTNTTSSDQDVVFKVVPTQGTCVGDTFNVTITVEAEPVAMGDVAEVCSDEALDIDLSALITNGVAISGFTYTVDIAPGNNRTADTTTANITDTYTNITDDTVVYRYTITPYSDNGCPGDAFEVVVTVNPEPILDPALGETICGDSTVTSGITLAVTGSSTAASSYNIVSITPDASLTGAAGNASTGTGQSADAIEDDKWYNVTSGPLDVVYEVSPVSDESCPGDTVSITLTIDPTVEVDAGVYADVLCSNGDLVLQDLGATMIGDTTAGTWSVTTGGTFSTTDFDATTYAGGSDTYTPSELDKDNGFVIITLTSKATSGSCPTISDSVTITINDLRCSQFPWTGNDDE